MTNKAVPAKAPIRLKFNASTPPPAAAQMAGLVTRTQASAARAVTPPPVTPPQCKTCHQPIVVKPKPRAPMLGTEGLVVKCGHTIEFELYVKDPFRDGRRAKDVARDCPACRQARVQTELAAAAAKKAAKQAAGLAAAQARNAARPRLPDGAQITAVYDAIKIRWTGTLIVDGVTFARGADSIRKLLGKLDDAYRAKLLPAAAPEVSEA